MPAERKLHVVAPEDRMRSDFYNFLGTILSRPPDDDLLADCTALHGGDTPLGRAVDEIARIAGRTDAVTVAKQFNALFIGLGRGEFLPYASYYLTGFLNEKPLARLRVDMIAWGMSRSADRREPEDNIASLMEMMSGLIVGKFGRTASLDDQQAFFNAHIGPWAGHFFSDLADSSTSPFYAAIGVAGREFMQVEQEAFRMIAA